MTNVTDTPQTEARKQMNKVEAGMTLFMAYSKEEQQAAEIARLRGDLAKISERATSDARSDLGADELKASLEAIGNSSEMSVDVDLEIDIAFMAAAREAQGVPLPEIPQH